MIKLRRMRWMGCAAGIGNIEMHTEILILKPEWET
jgi:hypothetical protein